MPKTIVVTKPNTVLRDLTVARVLVRAPGFQAVNVTAVGTGDARVNGGLFDFTHPAAAGTLTDCVAKPTKPNLWLTGVTGHDFTAIRVKVRRTVDGFGIFNTHNRGGAVNVLIDDCDVRDLAYFVNDPTHSDRHTHNDAVQIQGGSHITIRNSTLLALTAAGVGDYEKNPYRPAATGQALAVTPNVAPVSWLHVQGNTLDGGAQPITISPGRFGPTQLGAIIRNTIGRRSKFARAAAIYPSMTVDWHGNAYADGTPALPQITDRF